MTLPEVFTLLGLIGMIVGGVEGSRRWLLDKITKGDASLDAKLGGHRGQIDMDIGNLRDEMNREFLRTREFEVSQRNTERRLESIEGKLDKIPESIAQQSREMIAAIRDAR